MYNIVCTILYSRYTAASKSFKCVQAININNASNEINVSVIPISIANYFNNFVLNTSICFIVVISTVKRVKFQK